MNGLLSKSALDWLQGILRERLLEHVTIEYKNNCYIINCLGQTSSIIIDSLDAKFLEPGSVIGHSTWKASREGFVGIVNDVLHAPTSKQIPSRLVEYYHNHIVLHYDLLGLIYWALNRIEEINSSASDCHNRFPASASHAYKHGYLERPIIDEWLHILRQLAETIWPDEVFIEHEFSLSVSHDVDVPSSYAFKPWKSVIRSSASLLFRSLDIKGAINAILVKVLTKNELLKIDKNNTFDWLMEQSEKANIKSVFYFMSGSSNAKFDSDYALEEPAIKLLMKKIHTRGHEVGIHPSYECYLSYDALLNEFVVFLNACKKNNIKQSDFACRMHYLRWRHSDTLELLNDVGLDYDATLGYADMPGFRCGTCFEYPAFNIRLQKPLKIRIRPLIIMECSVFDKKYLGLTQTDEALSKFLEMKKVCQLVSGQYTLLWHNSYFFRDDSKNIYSEVVNGH